MRRSMWLVGISVALAMLASQATLAENSQQEKMKTCNTTATSKNLTGDERKAFMEKCLSHESTNVAKGNSQQEKMKSCNAEANTKALKGNDREAFMKTCLSGPHKG